MGMHSISNRDTHFVCRTTTHQFIWRRQQHKCGALVGSPRECGAVGEHFQDSVLLSPTLAPTLPEWPRQEQCESDLTTSAPASDVSAPACTNGVRPLTRLVSVPQKNRPLTMLCYPPLSNPSITPWSTRPDGPGRWENRMAAKHPEVYCGPAVEKNSLKRWRKRCSTHW